MAITISRYNTLRAYQSYLTRRNKLLILRGAHAEARLTSNSTRNIAKINMLVEAYPEVLGPQLVSHNLSKLVTRS